MDTTHPVGHGVVEPPSDLAATAADAAGGAGWGARVTPRGGGGTGGALLTLVVGLGPADLVAGLQALAPHVMRQPWSLMAPIRVDMPGAGDSPKPVLPCRPSRLAGLIAKILDRLGYEVVDV